MQQGAECNKCAEIQHNSTGDSQIVRAFLRIPPDRSVLVTHWAAPKLATAMGVSELSTATAEDGIRGSTFSVSTRCRAGRLADEFFEAAESSVRIPFFRWFARSADPPLQQQRPECRRARENQQPKPNASALRLLINFLNSAHYKKHTEQTAKESIGVHRINHVARNFFSHARLRSESRGQSDAWPVRPPGKAPVPQRPPSSPISKNRHWAWTCDSRACPWFPAK